MALRSNVSRSSLLNFRGDEKIPKSFYLIRCTPEVPYVTMKIAFLGGVSGVKRINVILRSKKRDKNLDRKRFEEATDRINGIKRETIYSVKRSRRRGR